MSVDEIWMSNTVIKPVILCEAEGLSLTAIEKLAKIWHKYKVQN